MYQELDMTEQERFKFSLHKNSLRYLHFDFLGFKKKQSKSKN